jgi:hypothetical protein
MKLEEIQSLWEADSKIDRTELGDESLKIPQLHSKYFKIYSQERLVLRKLEAEMKQLRLAKHEFYTQGPTKESQDLGWELPPIGKILKSEVSVYIDADKDIVNSTLKIAMQQEKVDFLDSIIRSLNNRGYNLKVAVDWEKFKVGI